MPIFFDENELTPEQRSRYSWAVAEYTRIQKENHERIVGMGKVPKAHAPSPQSALFARLLEGKAPLPYPPPTTYSYPWYDIIEKPGKYHVSVSGVHVEDGHESIELNQCTWPILRKSGGASDFLAFLRQAANRLSVSPDALALLEKALANQPEFIVTYGHWGEFRLSMGRIIRQGRRVMVEGSRFDLQTLEGGNPVIVRVLRTGAEIRAKADATLADVRNRVQEAGDELPPIDHITLASESSIPRSDSPEGDDIVEYDCDGWILERLTNL
ncbi:MAG: hypothetical protein HYS18_09415 [Burkholderiales bacterium]|nr:hypothetical protein [Burkholderiales bacterium]